MGLSAWTVFHTLALLEIAAQDGMQRVLCEWDHPRITLLKDST